MSSNTEATKLSSETKILLEEFKQMSLRAQDKDTQPSMLEMFLLFREFEKTYTGKN